LKRVAVKQNGLAVRIKIQYFEEKSLESNMKSVSQGGAIGPLFLCRSAPELRHCYSTNAHHPYDMNRSRIRKEKKIDKRNETIKSVYIEGIVLLSNLVSEYKHHKLKSSEKCIIFISVNRIEIKHK
jgi:hypothetical protein